LKKFANSSKKLQQFTDNGRHTNSQLEVCATEFSAGGAAESRKNWRCRWCEKITWPPPANLKPNIAEQYLNTGFMNDPFKNKLFSVSKIDRFPWILFFLKENELVEIISPFKRYYSVCCDNITFQTIILSTQQYYHYQNDIIVIKIIKSFTIW